MSRYRQTISAAFIFFLSAFYLGYAMFFIEIKNMSGVPDSAFIPRIVGVLMVVLSTVLLIGSIAKDRQAQPEEEQTAGKGELLNVFITAMILLVYIIMLQPIGFLISTTCYLFAQISFMTDPATIRNKKVLLKNFVIALVVTCLIYFLFLNVFTLILPAGILG